MGDAAVPFKDAFTDPTTAGADQWPAAVAVASEAARRTAEYAAKRGRSKNHAEASIGTPDPGAISFALITETLTPHIAGTATAPAG